MPLIFNIWYEKLFKAAILPSYGHWNDILIFHQTFVLEIQLEEIQPIPPNPDDDLPVQLIENDSEAGDVMVCVIPPIDPRLQGVEPQPISAPLTDNPVSQIEQPFAAPATDTSVPSIDLQPIASPVPPVADKPM